ncbi:MAG: hypothetical protein LBQ55_10970 [Treponema sp.]|jgi:hypothetical protein|nr:hypothetical protein [Treponema sp.]
MKKSLLLGGLAAFAVLLAGCLYETEYRYVENTARELIFADTSVADEVGLKEALDNPAYSVIAVTGAIADLAYNLSAPLVIPAGKTLLVYALIATTTKTVDIRGKVVLGPGGMLRADTTADHDFIVSGGGSVEVRGGRLEIFNGADALHNGAGHTALGAGRVNFYGGELFVTGVPFDTRQTIETYFGYVGRGTLEIAGLSSLKPSEIAAVPGISGSREIVVHATGTETVNSLTIPGGLTLTADNALTGKDITVYGSLILTNPASPRDVTIYGSLSVVGANSSGNVVVIGGSLTIVSGDLAITTGKVLTLSSAKLSGAGAIKTAVGGSINVNAAGYSLSDLSTVPAGVAADDFFAAADSIRNASAALADNLTLESSLFGANVRGIGTVSFTDNTSAFAIQDTPDGTAGSAIVLDSGITSLSPSSGSTASAADGGLSGLGGDFTLTYASGLRITDIGYTGSSDPRGVLTYNLIKLQTTYGLISHALGPFHVGVITKR